MENLQQKVSKVPLEFGRRGREEIKYSSDNFPSEVSYEGLRLVEPTDYAGPTSIMYWM